MKKHSETGSHKVKSKTHSHLSSKEIKKNKEDRDLDNRLKNTFPASDATAEY